MPAAGITILATLRNNDKLRILSSQAHRDLVVLGSELARGTVARPGDPNYCLLLKAAQTIHRFLDSIHNGEDETQEESQPPQLTQMHEDEMPSLRAGPRLLEFRTRFLGMSCQTSISGDAIPIVAELNFVRHCLHAFFYLPLQSLGSYLSALESPTIGNVVSRNRGIEPLSE